MIKAKLIANRNFVIDEIDERIYGSFAEHMGRVIYTGIYEPNHKEADEEGFRKDVLNKVKEMGVTCVRYPGGNFVSSYKWEDGVGSKENRPHRLDLAWRSIETNEFGTDEFIHWSKKAQVEPIFTVNLGTRGIEDAVNYLEYCNFPAGTKYSDMRIANGIIEPYYIKMWCLGNEMDGHWQVGHKTATEYGRLAAETAKAMKKIDPSIELIVCGSSLSTMNTYPDWDMEVLEHTYEFVDYLALHQYYDGQKKGTANFLAQTLDMENYIKTIKAVAQVVKQKKRSTKELKFSLDEWGVWAVPSNTVNEELDNNTWQIAPKISEQIYTLEDALLFAGMQMVILRNVDAIKIACQSLITNISACIMTESKGECWLQTIYYPFMYFSKYAKGYVLDTKYIGKLYDSEDFKNVPVVDSIVVINEKEKELVLFCVNRDEEEEVKLSTDLTGVLLDHVIDAITITAEDKYVTNQEDHNAVIPKKLNDVEISDNNIEAIIKPLSFNVIRICLSK